MNIEAFRISKGCCFYPSNTPAHILASLARSQNDSLKSVCIQFYGKIKRNVTPDFQFTPISLVHLQVLRSTLINHVAFDVIVEVGIVECIVCANMVKNFLASQVHRGTCFNLFVQV